MSNEHILDLAQRGAELSDATFEPPAGTASADDPTLTKIRTILLSDRFPRQDLPVETAGPYSQSEESTTASVRQIVLGSQQGYNLAHVLSTYEPVVYLQRHHDQPAQLGMLTANFDPQKNGSEDTYERLEALKFIPLNKAYPLNSKLLPDARMATMLAGAASTERAGVGSESNVGGDLEHRMTIQGALSLDNNAVAISHANHGVRADNSVASGLSNGQLGNLFAQGSLGDFPGYGNAVTISRANAGEATLLIPDSFLEAEDNEAFGVSYVSAERMLVGAGLQALYERQPAGQRSAGMLGSKIMALTAEVRPLR